MASILIVDDSRMVRHLVRAVLEQGGHSVIEAEDGLEAMEVLTRERFDLAVVDLNMPGMDGLELVRTVRADPVLADLPLLMLTTEGEIGDREAARQAGVSGFLQKPATAQELSRVVLDLLATSRGDAARPNRN